MSEGTTIVRDLDKATSIVTQYLEENYGDTFATWKTSHEAVMNVEGHGVHVEFDEDNPRWLNIGKFFPSFREAIRDDLERELGEVISQGKLKVVCGRESRCVTLMGADDGCDVDLVTEEGEETDYGTSYCIY